MDDGLGSKIRTIKPKRNALRSVGITIIVAAVLLGVIAIFNVNFAILLSPLALLAIIIEVIWAIVNRSDPKTVDVFDNGVIVHAPTWTKTILWNQVVGVQISRVSDVYYTPTYRTNQIALDWFTLKPHTIQYGHHLRRFHECRYVFHFSDDTECEIRGGLQLFDLISEIKASVFSRVIPEMIRRFERGEPILLTRTVTYSQSGIKGTLIRETRHAWREIPLDLRWGDIRRLYRTDRIFRITPNNGQPIIVPMSDIINAPGFLKILAALYEKDQVPAVAM